MKKWLTFVFGWLVGLGFAAGGFVGYNFFSDNFELINPLANFGPLNKDLPLNRYQIPFLKNIPLVQAELQLQELVAETETYSSYLFSVEVSGGSMSGQLNLPKNFSRPRVILMMRGYIPAESYQTGAGTKAAAGVFAQHQFITVAPDFLGFGQSDPDLADSWESRFIKPVQMMELVNDLRQTNFARLECRFRTKLAGAGAGPGTGVATRAGTGAGVSTAGGATTDTCNQNQTTVNLGIWAHSNGGQIALTALEGLGESIPTTLWAPVTSPFPYSVLFFTDELSDEGKATRLWLSHFERDYDVFAFTLTKHLDLLQGPIQIHHGTADESALFSWSLEFADKIATENQLRQAALEQAQLATPSAVPSLLEPLDFQLLTYDGADHNLRPVWNTVVLRDLEFFEKNLGQN